MGPVYMTQSTGGRVPASDSFYEAIGYCGHTRLPGLGPFANRRTGPLVWEESLVGHSPPPSLAACWKKSDLSVTGSSL